MRLAELEVEEVWAALTAHLCLDEPGTGSLR